MTPEGPLRTFRKRLLDANRTLFRAVIVELNIPSYRLEQARNNGQALGKESADQLDPDEPASASGLRPAPPADSSGTPVSVVEN
jgi:hypothetical protein